MIEDWAGLDRPRVVCSGYSSVVAPASLTPRSENSGMTSPASRPSFDSSPASSSAPKIGQVALGGNAELEQEFVGRDVVIRRTERRAAWTGGDHAGAAQTAPGSVEGCLRPEIEHDRTQARLPRRNMKSEPCAVVRRIGCFRPIISARSSRRPARLLQGPRTWGQ
jgi:hypothetical protein